MFYYLVKAFSYIVCLLPDGLKNKIGDLIGYACWPVVSKKRRKMAVNNVVNSLGVDKTAAEAIVKASAVRFGRMFLEVLCFPQLTRGNIHKHVILEGREYLEQAFAFGRGVLLITSHSGNWELMGSSLALYGFPIVGVAQKQTNEAMDRFINEYRSLSGMKVVYKSGVREMVSLLNEGMGIGLLMDQDAGEHGAFVDFFGRQASTPQGAAALARMRNAPIVPVFCTRNADGTAKVILHPVVWVQKTADRDADLWTTTQQLTTIIEQHIRKYPQEWFWLHNRWKTRPSAEKQ